MKVLLADALDPQAEEVLRALGCEVIANPALTPDELPGALQETHANVLVVRSTKVSADAIRAGSALDLIIRAGAGYDTIDVASASAEGIFVATCPGKNAIAVAELTWGLILCCDRRLPDQCRDLREETWNKKEYSKARGLYGRTLGILGLGTIAQEVLRRAKAFGMPVIAWSRSLSRERAAELGVTYAATPLEVAAAADVVSVHVAANEETKNLIDAAFVAAMKPGATLINTSRGTVVDEEALLEGVRTKGLRVGLDVFRNEPSTSAGAFQSALAREPGVYGTHHVGASTDQAQAAVAMEAARVVRTYLETGEVINCVNRASRSAATCTLTVRHRNRPGVLASVFRVLSDDRINVEEMENIIFEGDEAACAVIQLQRSLTEPQLQALRQCCPDILSVEQGTRARVS